MRAAFLLGPKTIECKEIPVPERQENEALVRVHAAGVCGSDLHFYSAGRIGDFVLKEPFIMGHEFAGIVEDPGEFAERLPRGTRVAVEPSIACGSCRFCRENRPNLCLRLTFVGFPPKSGGYAEWISLPPQSLHALPDSIRDEEAPLVETLAIALHTVELMEEVSGQTIAILGAGPVGLLTLMELRRCGARVGLVTEPIHSRRKVAQSFGAETAVDPLDTQAVSDCRRTLNGLGPDFVVEAAGQPESFQQALEIVRPGGTVVYCGIYPFGSMPIDFTPARRKELQILFVRRSLPHNYTEAIHLATNRQIDLSPLAGKTYPIERVSEAFQDAENRVPGLMKAILLFD